MSQVGENGRYDRPDEKSLTVFSHSFNVCSFQSQQCFHDVFEGRQENALFCFVLMNFNVRPWSSEKKREIWLYGVMMWRSLTRMQERWCVRAAAHALSAVQIKRRGLMTSGVVRRWSPDGGYKVGSGKRTPGKMISDPLSDGSSSSLCSLTLLQVWAKLTLLLTNQTFAPNDSFSISIKR